ncbi:ATP-dependent Clp protease ATP-binding subunit [Patescibacteria group bacterium]|nr:ATP-dependent Clp protease ATP-binding subunit [Patescibacteria group bacterium]
MSIDRLTHRAKTALLELPKRDSVMGATVLHHIEIAGGMGGYLIKAFPKLRVSTVKKVEVEKLVKEAYFQSIKLEHPYVGTEHLLLALLKLLSSKDFGKVKIELVRMTVFPYADRVSKTGNFPILDVFSKDLSAEALTDYDKPLIYRDVYDSFLESLLLKTSTNTLIIGESGVGKDALIRLLVRDIAYLEVPPALAGYHVLEFDIVAFITGLFNKSSGVDSSLNQLVDELKKLDRVILYIKNFQNLFSSTAMGSTIPVFYSLFVTALESADVKVVATVNTTAYDRTFGDNNVFFDKFNIIEVEEPDDKISKKVLNTSAKSISDRYNVYISDKVIDYLFEKSKDFPSNVRMPKKSILFLDQCCAHVLLAKGKIPQSYKSLVDSSIEASLELEDLLSAGKYEEAVKMNKRIFQIDNKLTSKEKVIFENPNKIELTIADIDSVLDFHAEKKDDRKDVNIKNLSSLKDRVQKRIIGQDNAVELVTKSLIRARMGLRYKNRPLGNFLFLGPTGVGKTELAKVLADEFFGEKSLIRLDMSDFGEKHTVARLVGSPPGYVGYGEGGELTTKISIKPDSVVLFDEIEKAHPDVLNILLQIMEEGELADAKGHTFSFSSSIVILTSNLGTDILHDSGIGFDSRDVPDSEVESRLRINVKKILKPELINRFDEIITFSRLYKESQLKILNLLIKDISRSLRDQQITLTIRKNVRDHLLKEGYSKEYGARALRRTMEKKLLDVIAEYLLDNTERPLKLVVTLVKDKVQVKSSPIKRRISSKSRNRTNKSGEEHIARKKERAD